MIPIFSMFSFSVQWMSLTDALTSGVGGLNLSVEDFQNVSHLIITSPPSSVSSLSDSSSAYPRIINPQVRNVHLMYLHLYY